MSSYSELTNHIPQGNTAQRPDEGVKVGSMFFDTQLNVTFYWDGSLWRRADGTLTTFATTTDTAWAIPEGSWYFGTFPGAGAYGDTQYVGISLHDKGSCYITVSVDSRNAEDDMTFTVWDDTYSVIQSLGTVSPGLYSFNEIADEVMNGQIYVVVENKDGPVTNTGKNPFGVYYTCRDTYHANTKTECDGELPTPKDADVSSSLYYPTAENWYRFETLIGNDYKLYMASQEEGASLKITLLWYSGETQNVITTQTYQFDEVAREVYDLINCPATTIYAKVQTDFPNSAVYATAYKFRLANALGPE